ncbi:MAG TPA: hypothetical protein QGF86_03595, partial [Nitrospinaceae bacterium]|nr:hypothetical protein [Nitrospinaceae bacterium]
MLCSVILWFINYFDIKRLFIEIVSTNSCAVGISSPKELRNCFARTHIFGSLQHAEISFASTLSVFQDLGYVIESGDFATGLITGKS